MMEEVSRTVLALANLATFSLLATSLAIGVVHVANGPQGSALCRACLEYRVAKIVKPDPKGDVATPAQRIALAAKPN